ncbi:MAG: hypothetical protein AAF823_15465 [Planctomycetota bacterium]
MSEGTAADPTIELLCPACGYNVTGGTSNTCPECGAPIDREQLAKPSIPWAIATTPWQTLTGFVKTVLLVTFRDRRIWREAARPVSLSSARSFHLISVLLAWLSYATFVIVDFADAGGQTAQNAFGWLGEGTPAVALWCIATAAIFPWLYTLTLIPTYWMHGPHLPVHRQNRAIAIACYNAAWLAWVPVAATIFIGGYSVSQFGAWAAGRAKDWVVLCWWLEYAGFGIAMAGLLVAVVAAPLGFVFTALRAASVAGLRGTAGLITLALMLPVAAASLFALTVLLWPALFLFAFIVLHDPSP